MNPRLRAFLDNKHTSIAAMCYALAELGTVWFPDFKSQLGQTQDWIIVYAMVFAGDAKPVASPEKTPEPEETKP